MLPKETIKHFFKRLWRKISLYASFPHLWIAVIILLLTLISFLFSAHFYYRENGYWASIFANISMGLLTGLVLCLITGSKQVFVAKLNSKRCFLEELHTKIKEFFQLYRKLERKQFERFDSSEELFDFIYNTGSHANWVNDYVLQSSFNEILSFSPCKYCKNKFHYDAVSLTDAYEELYQNLYEVDIKYPSKKEILGYFSVVEKELRQLNSAVCQEIKEIDIRLETVNRSLL